MPEFWEIVSWQLEPVFQSASLAIKSQRTGAGQYWESTVVCVLPKISLLMDSYIEDWKDQLWILLLLDQNGQYILVGDYNFPLRLDVDAKTGSDISDLNNLQLTFVGKSPFRPVFVDKPF